MKKAAPDRLSRLLAMVPYFQARPGIDKATAAADLGVTVKQLNKDLEQLFVCGLPGYMPDDLIEIEFTSDFVQVGFTAGLDRPLRLTGTEANVLLIALRVLADAGAVDADAVRRAMTKIEEAVGASHRPVASTSPSPTVDDPVRTAIRSAVTSRRALAIRYYSAGRDEVTRRVVDPIVIKAVDGHSYLEAWCRSSEGIRLFRFDRVEEATVLDESSDPPEQAAAASTVPVNAGTLTADLPSVRVEIDPDAVWLLEYYAAEPEAELDAEPTGPVVATLRYGSPQWLERFLLGFGGRVRLLEAVPGADIVGRAAAARARY